MQVPSCWFEGFMNSAQRSHLQLMSQVAIPSGLLIMHLDKLRQFDIDCVRCHVVCCCIRSWRLRGDREGRSREHIVISDPLRLRQLFRPCKYGLGGGYEFSPDVQTYNVYSDIFSTMW